MRFIVNNPPRTLEVGLGEPVTLKDCAHIELAPDEQVTLITESGAEYDVARKSWGYYATPSLNGRLQRFGLRAVLVKSPESKFYVFLVERGKEDDFQRYLDVEGHVVVTWMDDDAVLNTLEKMVKSAHEG